MLLRSEPQTHKYESQVRYSDVETSFMAGGLQREITRTYYDRARYNHILKDFRQDNLRSRVATATYQDKAGEGYDRATHYSYDIHGNVKSLVQEVKAHGTGLKKRVDYEYDLVSGKVNHVYYQRGETDQFIHRYEYDGDNRIVRVYTSRNGQVWEEDASYEYYGHGPLARTTLGEQKIETQNYVYTLQGWIKGVNGHEFSYALGYYESDYQSIGTSSNLATPVAKNLYNGNIATMATHTPAQGTKNPAHAWQTQQFVYDQLNRIKESRTLGGHENAYRTAYGYDANGNILSLSRFDGSGTKKFDILSYNYENKQSGYGRNTNRLRWVDDGTSVTEDFEDIKDQDTDNYAYDAIGNLVRDEQEEIDRIEWTVYGKVKAVHRKSGSEKPYLEFGYDAGGNRISKLSRDKDGHEKVTLYVRDASGNVMAIYEKTPERALAVTEHHVYGSSRLGIVRTNSASDLATLHSGRVLGLKDFEVSDHLGNVRVVLKDVRNSVGLTEVSGAYDYYPGGMIARSENSGQSRHTFNGKEYDPELRWQEYGERMYNPNLIRFPTVDPITGDYPMLTPYQFAGNRPIDGIDLEGLEYLRADEARVKMVGGEAHINLENCNNSTRYAWKQRDLAGNWPAGNIGWPRVIGELTHPDLPKYPDMLNLDNGYGANDPNYVTGEHKIQNPIAKSTGLPDRRYKERSVSGAPPSARAPIGGTILAFNVAMWGLEQYGIYQNNEDKQLLRQHMSILTEQVTRDLSRALETGMIPEKYQNMQDLGSISNVILSGVNPTDNQEIYDIGIDIVKKISGNYRYPLQMHYSNTGSDIAPADNVRTGPKVVPVIE